MFKSPVSVLQLSVTIAEQIVDVVVPGILLVGLLEMANGRVKIFFFHCLFSGLELRGYRRSPTTGTAGTSNHHIARAQTSPKIRASVIVECVYFISVSLS
jgi:hypothetical protein